MSAGRYAAGAGLPGTLPGSGDVVVSGWPGAAGPAPHQHPGAAGRLASWVTLCPGSYISARKSRSGRTGDGGSYIKPLLVQAAWAAIRVPGRLQARFHRLVRKSGGPEDKGREETGDHRDRAYPAQDRLRRPQGRQAVLRTRRRLLHPPRVRPGQAGLPAEAAAKAQPRLRHHHRPRGDRLIAQASRVQTRACPGAAPPPALNPSRRHKPPPAAAARPQSTRLRVSSWHCVTTTVVTTTSLSHRRGCQGTPAPRRSAPPAPRAPRAPLAPAPGAYSGRAAPMRQRVGWGPDGPASTGAQTGTKCHKQGICFTGTTRLPRRRPSGPGRPGHRRRARPGRARVARAGPGCRQARPG